MCWGDRTSVAPCSVSRRTKATNLIVKIPEGWHPSSFRVQDVRKLVLGADQLAESGSVVDLNASPAQSPVHKQLM